MQGSSAHARRRLAEAAQMTIETPVALDRGRTGPGRRRSVPVGRSSPVRVEKTPGRNEPCFCGSGKKYKLCHGR